MSIFVSILSGALGGILAIAIGNLIIQTINKPKLKFDQGVIKTGSSVGGGEQRADYKIQIQNTGRSVATNCKPRIRLVGTHDTTIVTKALSEKGEPPERVPVTKKYNIDITPEWDESDSPSRIDINRDEVAKFRLFEATSSHRGPVREENIKFGDIIPEDEREQEDSYFSTPVRIKTPSYAGTSEPSLSYKTTVNRETFLEIDWKIKEISITSANAKKIESKLDIRWEKGDLPRISLIDDKIQMKSPFQTD